MSVLADGADGGTRTPTSFRPTDFLTCYGFRRRCRQRLWSGLSLHLSWPDGLMDKTESSVIQKALGAARLVSTPSLSGLARDCHVKGFPEFGQFYFPGFPRSTQIFKSVASTGFATSACRDHSEPKSATRLKNVLTPFIPAGSSD